MRTARSTGRCTAPSGFRHFFLPAVWAAWRQAYLPEEGEGDFGYLDEVLGDLGARIGQYLGDRSQECAFAPTGDEEGDKRALRLAVLGAHVAMEALGTVPLVVDDALVSRVASLLWTTPEILWEARNGYACDEAAFGYAIFAAGEVYPGDVDWDQLRDALERNADIAELLQRLPDNPRFQSLAGRVSVAFSEGILVVLVAHDLALRREQGLPTLAVSHEPQEGGRDPRSPTGPARPCQDPPASVISGRA